MVRVDGMQGTQLRVNVYPTPSVAKLAALSKSISDVVNNCD